MSTVDQREEAKHDLVLADLEKRLEEIRQLKTYEGWRLAFQGLTAGATLFAAGAAVGALLVHFVR
jgi:hypothetical protein